MDRQRRVWQEPKPKCVRKIAPSDLIVGMDSVYSAFILLVAGSLLSIGLLLIEILRHRLAVARRERRRRRGRQWQQPRTRPRNLPQDHGWVYPYVDWIDFGWIDFWLGRGHTSGQQWSRCVTVVVAIWMKSCMTLSKSGQKQPQFGALCSGLEWNECNFHRIMLLQIMLQ